MIDGDIKITQSNAVSNEISFGKLNQILAEPATKIVL